MDPVIANLDLDPPVPPSPVRRGLLPALVVHALFFIALALSLQWKGSGGGDELAGRPDTSAMGAAPALPQSPSQPESQSRPQPQLEPQSQAAVAEPSPSPTPPASTSLSPTQPLASRSVPAAAVATPGTPRPSFDCAKARSRNERLICNDPELARLDRETGRLHARALAAAHDPAALKRQDSRAWKQREARCHDKPCLLAWYAQRREQLQQTLAQSR